MLDVRDISLLGDHLALDFVNTVESRDSDDPDDVLRRPGDLARWAGRVGVAPAAGTPPTVTHAELAAAIAFREDLHLVLRAHVTGQEPPRAALAAVGRAIVEALDARRLTAQPEALAWVWARPSAATVRYSVALAANELLTDPTLLGRTRLCAAAHCGWFYLDRSKNGSRRWCSMEGCGTREKARRRAARG